MPIVLSHFGLAEMLRCGNGLRTITRDAPTLEAAARQACRYLANELVSPDGTPACVMVRCYKTHAFGELPSELQDAAGRALARDVRPSFDMSCLALLATAGAEPAWNDRRRSVSHQAIPLPTSSMIEQAPMIAALFRGLGVDVAQVIRPTRGQVPDFGGRSYGVFHVEDAAGSPHIPAQDFVQRYGIRSVIGCGGTLQSGDLFALILFTRLRVGAESADRWRTIALDLKSRFFLYDGENVFDQEPLDAAMA